MQSNAKRPTKAESDRMAAIKRLGICMACFHTGIESRDGVDIHHLLDCGRRRGHAFTVGLCAYHHRGEPGSGMTRKARREFAGPALSDGSRLFREAFGSDDELLESQNALLEELA